jgi:uncharacterized membrane protein YgcG
MAVAIVERLDTELSTEDEDVDNVVEAYARKMHDEWGVGYETSKGGTGVLIFLNVYDRAVYISRGGALDRILNDPRIDRIIEEMKPSLRLMNYEMGIGLAIESLVEFIEKGEPNMWESLVDFFRFDNLVVVFWIFLAMNGILSSWRQRRRQREYAHVASQLSELDRAQAEATQGNYTPQTSCPICLEPFQSDGQTGSDGHPIKLLRCGHVFDESCWSEWVSTGRGDVMKCPVCRMKVGPSRHEYGGFQEQVHAPSSVTAEDTNEPSAAPTFGAVGAEGQNRGLVFTFQNDLLETNRRADRDRALRLYHQERNFRLMRLSNMYSRYITSEQVSRWSSPAYNGQMVRDPAFEHRNPSRNLYRDSSSDHNNRIFGLSSCGGGSGFGSGGFGGGRSAGGRSGRF